MTQHETPRTNGAEALTVPEGPPFALDSLRDDRLRVTEPFSVERLEEDGQCVLEATEINEFGFGENLSKAIADLQAAIAELYFSLEEERERLGADLENVWSILSQKVHRVDATRSA